jgi:glycosyltransferase involved in cell wall biosynthesis
LEQETTYPYRIWISDDCSTDGTLEICNSYAERYPEKIKVIAHPINTFSTPGVIPHNETAIKSVKTKYYCVFDGDDAWCDSQKIQIALDFLENHLEYTTFAHDTWYHDTAAGTRRSLVHDILQAEIQNPVDFEDAPYLHTSARVHRNVVKYVASRKIIGDIFLYYSYLDKGPLYYYDKVMSIYNMTGQGVWSSLSRSGRDSTLVTTQYKLNRYFNYRHDDFFTKRAGNVKGLDSFKKIFGKRLGWALWYRLVYNNVYSLENLKSKIKQIR